MYVLDTSIISEIMKPSMDWNVLCWFQDRDEDLHLTSISLMELHYGIMRLPEGKRKNALKECLNSVIKECTDNILLFDSFSAYLCADLRCRAQSAGLTPEIADTMIASICLRHGATLVTRNVKDFDYVEGLSIVNPFDYESPVLAKLTREEAQRGR